MHRPAINQHAAASGGQAKPLSASDKHLDELLDEALAETFPASDPVSSLDTAVPSNAQSRQPS
jgi:hypothetical protein